MERSEGAQTPRLPGSELEIQDTRNHPKAKANRAARGPSGRLSALGLAASAVDTMMVDAGVSEAVARAALAVADRLR